MNCKIMCRNKLSAQICEILYYDVVCNSDHGGLSKKKNAWSHAYGTVIDLRCFLFAQEKQRVLLLIGGSCLCPPFPMKWNYACSLNYNW
jgi:hypothetical protein